MFVLIELLFEFYVNRSKFMFSEPFGKVIEQKLHDTGICLSKLGWDVISDHKVADDWKVSALVYAESFVKFDFGFENVVKDFKAEIVITIVNYLGKLRQNSQQGLTNILPCTQ